MMKSAKIFAIHLLNDFSGSPNVFAQSITALINEGRDVTILTSNSKGFLSDIKKANYHFLNYKWNSNKWITLFNFFKVQLQIFIYLLLHSNRGDIVYINSVLPFAAAIAGKCKRCEVVYHIHEVSIQPQFLKSFLKFFIKDFSDKNIFVSNFVAQNYTDLSGENRVIYNSLSNNFSTDMLPKIIPEKFTVLMLCSVKEYKGIEEFAMLAEMLPLYDFLLVMNGNENEILEYKNTHSMQNLHCFSNQKNTHFFYHKSSLVINLSHPDKWVETFGMTILEGMHYALPAIVPTIGGITELVVDEENGFKINSTHLDDIAKSILLLATDNRLYQTMATKSLTRVSLFSSDKFKHEILSFIS